MLDALGALLIILADYKWDVFILGGAAGALSTIRWGEKSLLLTCIPLILVFAVMFIEEEHTMEEQISEKGQ